MGGAPRIRSAVRRVDHFLTDPRKNGDEGGLERARG